MSPDRRSRLTRRLARLRRRQANACTVVELLDKYDPTGRVLAWVRSELDLDDDYTDEDLVESLSEQIAELLAWGDLSGPIHEHGVRAFLWGAVMAARNRSQILAARIARLERLLAQ